MSLRASWILAVLGAACALLVAPAIASAHTKLVAATPKGTVTPAPKVATLQFSRDIGDALGDVVVSAPNGDAYELEPSIDGDTATMQLPRPMAAGRWVLEWTITGADGHAVRATQPFTVKAAPKRATPDAPPAGDPAPDGDVAVSGEGDRQPADSMPHKMDHDDAAHMRAPFPVERWERVSLVARIVFFVALLAFVGGGAFAIWAAQGFRPWRWGAMAAAVALGALGVLTAHTAIVDRRTGTDFLAPGPWFSGMVAEGARGYVVAALAAAVAWFFGRELLAPPRWRARDGALPWPVIAFLAAAIVAPSFSSHATATDSWLRLPLDMVHLVAAAVWVGGLVQVMSLTIRARSKHPGIPGAIDRYSRMAFGSVVVLVLTGTYAAWVELDGDVGDLVSSTYGRLVLLKLALVLCTVPFAWRNKNRNVPDLQRVGPRAVPRLRRYVLGELAILVWVVVATAFLVYETPPRHDMPAQHHAVHHQGAAK